MKQMSPVRSPSARRASVLAQFDKRWLGAAAAATAGATLVASSENANATIVTFTPAGGINIPVTATGVFINIETGANSTTSYATINGGNAAAPAFNFWGSSSNRVWMYPTASAVNRLVGTAGNITVKNPGDTVSAADVFMPSATSGSPAAPAGVNWNNTAGFEGYMGFKFLNGAGTGTDFGWVHVKYNAWNGTLPGGGSVIAWSYDDSGAAVTIPGGGGVTPEPTSLALLALGGAGLVARRRR